MITIDFPKNLYVIFQDFIEASVLELNRNGFNPKYGSLHILIPYYIEDCIYECIRRDAAYTSRFYVKYENCLKFCGYEHKIVVFDRRNIENKCELDLKTIIHIKGLF